MPTRGPWALRRRPHDLAGLPRSRAADLGIYAGPFPTTAGSDNSNFTAWNVPNANLVFMDPFDSTEVHYAGHMHDPYDSAAFARREAATLENMAGSRPPPPSRPRVDDPSSESPPSPTDGPSSSPPIPRACT